MSERPAALYRARRYADVVGQEAAIARLHDAARDQRGASVLLTGPPGCGKSVLAAIYARALLCRTGGLEACERPDCPDCKAMDRDQHPNRQPGRGLIDEATLARVIAEAPASEHWSRGRLVFLVEVSERLASRIADAIHARIARQPPGISVILTAPTPDAVPERVRQLLWPVPVPALSIPARLALIERVRGSRLDEDEARLELCRQAGGAARVILRDLERIAGHGPLTRAVVRAAYGLDATAPAARYLGLVLAGRPIREQIAVLDTWAATPAEQIAGIEALVADLLGAELLQDGGLPVETGPNAEAPTVDLSEALRARAPALGLSPRRLYAEILTFWARDSEASLLARLNTFDERLNGPGGVADAVPGLGAPVRRRRTLRALPPLDDRAPARDATRESPAHYLTRTQVRALWEAGSFLVQHFGLCLNVRISLAHAALGLAPETVGPTLSELTHELGMRVSERCKAAGAAFDLPYLYGHETGAHGGVTHLVAAIPEQAGDIVSWLEQAWLPRRTPRNDGASSIIPVGERPALRIRYWPGATATPERLVRHHRLLALLCRGCDPAAPVRPGRAARLSAHLIPERLRGPIGPRPGAQRYGIARVINARAQEAVASDLPMLTPFAAGAPDNFRGTWELAEHAYRMHLCVAKATLEDAFQRDWPDTSEPLARMARTRERKALDAAWAKSLRHRCDLRPGFTAQHEL